MSEDGSKHAQRRRETRQRLLIAALAVFGRRGYEAATVDDIVAAAGYSKGAFYFHFPSKEDIFLELLHTYLMAGEEGPPFAAADRQKQEADDQQRQIAPLLLEFWAHAARNEHVREGLAKLYEARRRRLLQTLDPTSRETRPTAELTRLLIALEDGLLVQAIMGSQPASGERLVLLQRLLHAFALSFDETAAPPSADTVLSKRR